MSWLYSLFYGSSASPRGPLPGESPKPTNSADEKAQQAADVVLSGTNISSPKPKKVVRFSAVPDQQALPSGEMTRVVFDRDAVALRPLPNRMLAAHSQSSPTLDDEETREVSAKRDDRVTSEIEAIKQKLPNYLDFFLTNFTRKEELSPDDIAAYRAEIDPNVLDLHNSTIRTCLKTFMTTIEKNKTLATAAEPLDEDTLIRRLALLSELKALLDESAA